MACSEIRWTCCLDRPERAQGSSMIRIGLLESVQRVLLAVLVIVVLAVVSLSAHAYWTWRRYIDGSTVETSITRETWSTAAVGGPVGQPEPVESLSSEGRPLIGIVVGHWESDTGAVCPDGLTEVEINLAVAEHVVSLLSRAGYRVEILPEFSPKLDGYRATALVSIHSDSCNVREATGFKVARVSSSTEPEVEDRLVACLTEQYARITGLAFHANSITFDMTEYHAFYEIAPDTPAAIIEIGFMAADRPLLTRRPDLVARGIVEGIHCFLDSSD
jgi:N-acetylmuramoyl-L-alanine amidase